MPILQLKARFIFMENLYDTKIKCLLFGLFFGGLFSYFFHTIIFDYTERQLVVGTMVRTGIQRDGLQTALDKCQAEKAAE